MASWSFLTNHGLVLTYLGRYPDSTGLESAPAMGITERPARKIVADLLTESYIEREKVGRRNSYRRTPIARCGTRANARPRWGSCSGCCGAKTTGHGPP